jgi:hypothetical protein
MYSFQLRHAFAQLGARFMYEPVRELWQSGRAAKLVLSNDHRGEYFHLMVDPLRVIALDLAKFNSLDAQLVLQVRQRSFGSLSEAPDQLFVCAKSPGGWSVQELDSISRGESSKVKAARPYRVVRAH